jgi:hypothetical protein
MKFRHAIVRHASALLKRNETTLGLKCTLKIVQAVLQWSDSHFRLATQAPDELGERFLQTANVHGLDPA